MKKTPQKSSFLPSQDVFIQFKHFILCATGEIDFTYLTNSYCPMASWLATFVWLQKGRNPLGEGETEEREQRPRDPTLLPLVLFRFIWGVCDSWLSSLTPNKLPSNHSPQNALLIKFFHGESWSEITGNADFIRVLSKKNHLIVAAPWQVLSHSECFIAFQNTSSFLNIFLFFFLSPPYV